MSISSLSADDAIARLEVGRLFWVYFEPSLADRRRSRGKAMYRKVNESDECALIIDGAGDLLDEHHHHCRGWVPKAVIQPLTDDESARITALIALGRGDLI